MKLLFWGATGTTTGSHHLLQVEGDYIALDCGLFQGKRSEFYERNKEFPVDPSQVDNLILSHAHIDHSGNIPNFVKQGFLGRVIATHATSDLCRAMLLDSAHIQEKETEWLNKKKAKKNEPAVEPLYTMKDAEQSLELFQSFTYYRNFPVTENVTVKFLDAGHILGSAQVQLDIKLSSDKEHRLVFSGDIGRGKRAILREPEIPSETDTLIMESTYGDRISPPVDNLRQELRDLVQKVYDRGGKIIIPAFSVGRTQEIVYQLNCLFNDGELPRMKIFVDSPLSTNVTQVFRSHPECFNRLTHDELMEDDDVFGFENLRYTRNVQDSKNLNTMEEPMVIISASGMCETGRILHHLRNSIEDPKNCVLIVGFQAEHTLGRRLVEKQDKVKIFGETHPRRCEVKVLNGFSAHADQNELRDYVFRVHARSGGKLKRVYLVHGETDAQNDLKDYIESSLSVETIIPARGESFDLITP